MLPSTNPKASAPRTSTFSVLISPAHPYRYRRFACPLAGTDARLAEKRGSVTPSFQGTYTPYLLPVRLAHRILVLPKSSQSRENRLEVVEVARFEMCPAAPGTILRASKMLLH